MYCTCKMTVHFKIDDNEKKVYCSNCGHEVSSYQMAKFIERATPKFDYINSVEQPNENTHPFPQNIDILNDLDPKEMIPEFKGSKLLKREEQLIDELINDIKLSKGSTNILLQYVMLKNEMRMPVKFTIPLAKNIKRLGLTTAQETYKNIMHKEKIISKKLK